MPPERQRTRRQASPLHLFLSLVLYHLLVCFSITITQTHRSPPTLNNLTLSSVPHLQTASSALQGAIQLGIGYTVGNLSSKPERDVLMQDFYVVESIFFPRCVCMSDCVTVRTCAATVSIFISLSSHLHTAKAATSHQPTTTRTLGLKPMPLWPSDTSESCLVSGRTTTW